MYWLDTILEVQTETYIKLRGVDKPNLPKDNKIRRQQEKNQTIISQHPSGEVSRFEFIKKCA